MGKRRKKKFSNRTPCMQLKTVRYKNHYKKTNSFFFKNQRKTLYKKNIYIYIKQTCCIHRIDALYVYF